MPIGPIEAKEAFTFDESKVKAICDKVDEHLKNSSFMQNNRQKDANGLFYWEIELPPMADLMRRAFPVDVAEIIRLYKEAGWKNVEEIHVPEDRGAPGYNVLRLYTENALF